MFAIGSCGVFIDWEVLGKIPRFDGIAVDFASVPDKVLEEFIRVLFPDNQASGVDDVTGVVNETATLWRQLVDVDGRVVAYVAKTLVYLVVCGQAALAESLDGAVETDLRDDEGIDEIVMGYELAFLLTSASFFVLSTGFATESFGGFSLTSFFA